MRRDTSCGADVSLTAQLADLVARTRRSEVPEHLLDRSRQCIADCLGVMVAGGRGPVAQAVLDSMTDLGLRGERELIGQPLTADALSAALYHGTAAHALDFDDTL